MAATTTRRPRKSGNPRQDQAAADAAIAAENAKITPEPEPQPEPEPTPEPTPEPQPAEDEREDEDQEDEEPEPSEPTAQLNIGRYPYWMHRPMLTGPDGAKHTCPHRDGHTKVRDAMTCARSMGSEAGLTVPDADPSWTDGGAGEPVS